MHSGRIFHLGGGGRFHYIVSSVPKGSDNWLVEVRGERPTKPTEVLAEELVEYANCRDEIEAVKRYMDKYGPLELVDRKYEDLLYADTLGRWRASQLIFRQIWNRILALELRDGFTETYGKHFPELSKAQAPWCKIKADGEFCVTAQGLIFLATTHSMALRIKLLAVSAAGKLRKCLNPGCPYTPYFVADHGKTQYCSVECGNWGQRQAKLKYWHDNKQTKGSVQNPSQAEVAVSKKVTQMRKDGTQKAR